MHELAITRSIVAIASEAARGRKVRKVTVAIGQLAGVMADAVAFCFDMVARDTPIEGAALEIVHVEGRGRCRRCASEFPCPTLFSPCPCGARDIELVAGEEMLVRSIELDDEEAGDAESSEPPSRPPEPVT